MANLSKFHVFSSSTLIRLDKDAFEGHLCQTVNAELVLDHHVLLLPKFFYAKSHCLLHVGPMGS